MTNLPHRPLPTPSAISQKENLKSIRRQSNASSEAWKMLSRNYSQMTLHLFHKFSLKFSHRKISLKN
ncbi:adducin 3 [Rhinolophus ferrumequinum]|uniref:Adducin 3 n=1 Tax=Rhinolophus ferrumequinum TaxID=59479 RepID=A0A7J7UVC0_RHIFE|nr:adducin 3 [Rhinolophus ferrumequinum]